LCPLKAQSNRTWLRRFATLARMKKRAVLMSLSVVAVVAIGAPFLWTRLASSGHVHETSADAPEAPVVIVFGAELAPGGERPKPFLAGRLDVAAELVRAGKARAVLVSGDSGGSSGDEIAAMTRYLVERGVDGRRIAADPHGLDTYDTCVRAVDVYGVRRALLVSQAFHLPRAVTLCRRAGMEADGVHARCDSCRTVTLRRNAAREVGADVKAVGDALRRRGPAVDSPPDDSVADALRR
jgi:vancomycin permeability regulator SanA